MIALSPPILTRRDLGAGLLVPVYLKCHRAGCGLSLLYPSRRHLPLAVSAFIDLMIERQSAVEALPTAQQWRPS